MRYSILLIGLLTSYFPSGCSKSPPHFNPSDVHETARWAGEILKPLNSPLEGMNQIARNDTLQAEMLKIKAGAKPLVGQVVSWEMDCGVDENVVTLFPSRYNDEGAAVLLDLALNSRKAIDEKSKVISSRAATMSREDGVTFLDVELKKMKQDIESLQFAIARIEKDAKSTDKALDFVLMVLDHRPKIDQYGIANWEEHSDLRFFQIAVPDGIGRAEAKALSDKVAVHAMIKEFEIGKYRSEKSNERYLLYIYLSDIKLSPTAK